MQIISVDIENANSPGAKACVRPHICQGKPMAATSHAIRIKVPLNVSVAELLVWVQLLKADYFGLGHAEPPRREPGGASSERQKC